MAHESSSSSKKWYVSGGVFAASLLLLVGARGCVSGTATPAAWVQDPRPDPKQPFSNMNAAGCFVNRGDHAKPQLQIPAHASPAAIAQAVAQYVNQIITSETHQLYSPNQIQQGMAGAAVAGANAYSTAIANGASAQQANQMAMVAAAQFLHNQGVMGPLICPVALGLGHENTGVIFVH